MIFFCTSSKIPIPEALWWTQWTGKGPTLPIYNTVILTILQTCRWNHAEGVGYFVCVGGTDLLSERQSIQSIQEWCSETQVFWQQQTNMCMSRWNCDWQVLVWHIRFRWMFIGLDGRNHVVTMTGQPALVPMDPLLGRWTLAMMEDDQPVQGESTLSVL